MNRDDAIFTTGNDEYGTPQALFEILDAEFHFTLDPCATDQNHKCEKYYTIEDDGLTRSWAGERVFCNPPYSQIKSWARKAREEAEQGVFIVMLVPARTDTKWFHEYVYGVADLRFIKGRLTFEPTNNKAPFPSVLCIFNQEKEDAAGRG